jgi:hypothetical protein
MHRQRHFRGHGCRGRRRSHSREERLQRLEEYQRDLEQEIADVAAAIERLRRQDATPAGPV